MNRSYRHTGTLWEGRFKSCLAQDEHYVLTCYRYVELNPVRAKMVAHPQEYPWSSYASNGSGILNDLITPHPSYISLGDSKSKRLECYRQFLGEHMEESVLEEVRNATNGNFVPGDNRFKAEIEQALQRRVSPGQSGKPRLTI